MIWALLLAAVPPPPTQPPTRVVSFDGGACLPVKIDSIPTLLVNVGDAGVLNVNFPATQPVSLASVPSHPVTGTLSINILDAGAPINVQGAFYPATQPVSIATMPSTPVTGTFWQATQPVSGTVTANQGGTWYMRNGGATSWSCSLDNIGATLTKCATSPGAGLRYYVTDIIINSTTATGGQFELQTGTGTNCGTGTANFFPAATTTARFGYPGNAAASLFMQFTTPLTPPQNVDICIKCIATNTCAVQMQGFTAP